MCTTANAILIDQIIEDWADKELMFTAFDVTQEGKARGTTERHGQLKSAVHGNWDNLRYSRNYSRTLIQTPGGQAWLFHPDGGDISDYTDKFDIDQPDDDDDGLASPNTYGTPAPSVAAPSGQNVNITKEGRLNVGPDLLAPLGVSNGDFVMVYTQSGKIIVTAHSYPKGTYHQYQISFLSF